MAYLSLLLLIRTSVCIDVFTGCMPPKTAWDRALRRSKCELNFIPQSRVLKQWKKDQEIDTSSRVHNFSHLSNRNGRQKNGARTERTWYLIGKAADRCLLKVGHSDVSNDALLIHYTIWKRSAKLREDTFTRSVQKCEDALPWPCRSPEKKRKDA